MNYVLLFQLVLKNFYVYDSYLGLVLGTVWDDALSAEDKALFTGWVGFKERIAPSAAFQTLHGATPLFSSESNVFRSLFLQIHFVASHTKELLSE